jgi:ethanolamine utilization microcompartment shell protein EutL
MVTPAQKMMNQTCEIGLHVGAEATIGYFCTRLFTQIKPVCGAVLCAFASVASLAIAPFAEKLFARYESNQASRIVGSLLNGAVGIIATAAFAALIGCPITIAAGIELALYILAVRLLTLPSRTTSELEFFRA